MGVQAARGDPDTPMPLRSLFREYFSQYFVLMKKIVKSIVMYKICVYSHSILD